MHTLNSLTDSSCNAIDEAIYQIIESYFPDLSRMNEEATDIESYLPHLSRMNEEATDNRELSTRSQ
ncbi:MAG TPA: hypothetical protein VK078_04620 [Pseudogracilibacillus sp.]|nr:hypothetical protein [Pseudogracilibacillus sp.]